VDKSCQARGIGCRGRREESEGKLPGTIPKLMDSGSTHSLYLLRHLLHHYRLDR
jgi:hypothetical protein